MNLQAPILQYHLCFYLLGSLPLSFTSLHDHFYNSTSLARPYCKISSVPSLFFICSSLAVKSALLSQQTTFGPFKLHCKFSFMPVPQPAHINAPCWIQSLSVKVLDKATLWIPPAPWNKALFSFILSVFECYYQTKLLYRKRQGFLRVIPIIELTAYLGQS